MGDCVNRLESERTDLLARLQAVLGEPWRVHKYAPSQPVAPCAWIGSPELVRATVGTSDTPSTVATFPVTAVVNGDETKQMEMLDEMVSRIWDASWTRTARPVDSRPTVVDVGGAAASPRGGAQLRGQIVRIETQMLVATLCTQTMENN